MLVLSVLFVCIVIGTVLAYRDSADEGVVYVASVVLAVICGACLVVALIAIPFSRMSYMGGVAKAQSVQQTLTTSRENADINPLEQATIQNEVIKWNVWIASAKHYNGTIWDIWIPDEVMELKPIE